jgi:hypothetical protein
VRLLGPRSNLDRTGHCVGRHSALGSEMAWAKDRATWATRPERRPRDQDRRGRHDAALSFPFGIGTKAVNRFYVHQFSLLLISRHQFLHFTVNQYTTTHDRVRGSLLRL